VHDIHRMYWFDAARNLNTKNTRHDIDMRCLGLPVVGTVIQGAALYLERKSVVPLVVA
jgi:hypothetical protein